MKRKVVAAGMAAMMTFSVMAGTGATIVKADRRSDLKRSSQTFRTVKNGQGLVEQMIIWKKIQMSPSK